MNSGYVLAERAGLLRFGFDAPSPGKKERNAKPCPDCLVYVADEHRHDEVSKANETQSPDPELEQDL
ncbi:MAG: hypothetical protein JNK17_04085 [Hydrogenophaga sp.]|nr:hypothetical protein [Hydrogenophaga sp.]